MSKKTRRPDRRKPTPSLSTGFIAQVVRWAGPVAIVLTGIGMTVWTWQTWADVLIDFGREVYVPWQLTQGKVLYRDIAYFNGPLSPYLNTLVFKIFGVSLMSLVWVN